MIKLFKILFSTDILNSLANNRLAPVQEVPETEELLKAIEFPLIGNFSHTLVCNKQIIRFN